MTDTLDAASAPAADLAGSQSSDATRTVPTRRISFEESLAQLPKHFAADGDLIVSHLAAALSAVFPDGEDFFVRSVRHFRDDVTDPVLKRQVAGFIGQESVHGREHRVLNDRLHALGYPAKRYERRVARGLAFQERITSPMSCLAHTAAVEHFTATLAELILTDPEVTRLLGPEIGDVFLWHALEEAEHKAVAFDVFKAVGGTEKQRIREMKIVRVMFLVATVLQVIGSLAGDPAARRRGAVRASWKRFKRSPIMSKELWRRLKDYDRPGFHPDDRDTTDLVDTWRAELFGDAGTLNHLLAASAGRTEEHAS